MLSGTGEPRSQFGKSSEEILQLALLTTLALAEANRLRPTWAFIRPSDIEMGERATASLVKDMGVWDRCSPRGPGRTCAV